MYYLYVVTQYRVVLPAVFQSEESGEIRRSQLPVYNDSGPSVSVAVGDAPVHVFRIEGGRVSTRKKG